ncbi:MAG TPA: hypothetical protein VKA60_23435 [Blastocatellia bacterium]|nr:hypothetical protein [Blastocatellia bacterium]
MKHITLALLCVILLVTPAAPQGTKEPPSLVIAGVTLQIGMLKEGVLAKLSRTCKLTEGSDNRFTIMRKFETDDFTFLGSITFTADKVSLVQKHWLLNNDTPSADDLADAIFAVVSHLEEINETVTELKTRTLRDAGFSAHEVIIRTGHRQVVIVKDMLGKNRIIQVDEYISAKPWNY